MEIDKKRIDGTTVITPHGPLAKADADQFRGIVLEVRTHTDGKLVLDASTVPFADSRGLEAMLDITDAVQSENGEVLHVAASNDTLREVMELTGIAGDFEFFEDVASAVRSFE